MQKMQCCAGSKRQVAKQSESNCSAMSKENFVTFFNGHKMPIIGLGTWQSSASEVEAAVIAALEIGYRHIDTAYAYQNEEAIGNGLIKFLESNKNVKRDDIFVTTKLPIYGLHRDKVEFYLKKSLERLKLQYVDLYLVHCSFGVQNVDEQIFPIGEDGTILLDLTTNLEEIWKGMEAVCDAGLTKSIGISNFNSSQIQRILDSAKIQPANLQVECHAYFAQSKLFEYCKKKGITFCAYSPIGNPSLGQSALSQAMPGAKLPVLLEDPVVAKLAKKHNKSPAQILLRWLIQRGIVVIPKSVTPSRIKENFDVFGFTLSEAESEELNKLDKNTRLFSFGKELKADRHPEYSF